MYDYVFAVAQEGTTYGYEHSSVSIVDASPWRDHVEVIQRITVDNMRQRRNAGFEGLTYDPIQKKLIASQESDPMQIWSIDPESGRAEKILNEARWSKTMRDFASVYKRAGDSGLYVLSEPSERVLKLDEDGRMIDGQIISIKGSLPEGVTFTPDGLFMVIVGEPNEMFFYSVTGSCDYNPDPSVQIKIMGTPVTESGASESSDGATGHSERDDASEGDENSTSIDDISIPIVTEGFCSADKCSHGHPVAWCAVGDAHRCVGSCGAWWCSNIQGVPPITRLTYVAPPPPTAPPSPPSPPSLPSSPEAGFCGAGTCQHRHALSWCQLNVDRCVGGCAALWCPTAEGRRPISRANYTEPQPPASPAGEEPPAGGYCSASGCNFEHPNPWCSGSSHRCVKGCAATWCPGKGVTAPTKRNTAKNQTLPATSSKTENQPPSTPWHQDPANGFCSYQQCGQGGRSGNPWCQSSLRSCIACRGMWCPRAAFKQEKPISQANISDIIAADEEDDEQFEEGFSALMTLLLHDFDSAAPAGEGQLKKVWTAVSWYLRQVVTPASRSLCD